MENKDKLYTKECIEFSLKIQESTHRIAKERQDKQRQENEARLKRQRYLQKRKEDNNRLTQELAEKIKKQEASTTNDNDNNNNNNNSADDTTSKNSSLTPQALLLNNRYSSSNLVINSREKSSTNQNNNESSQTFRISSDNGCSTAKSIEKIDTSVQNNKSPITIRKILLSENKRKRIESTYHNCNDWGENRKVDSDSCDNRLKRFEWTSNEINILKVIYNDQDISGKYSCASHKEALNTIIANSDYRKEFHFNHIQCPEKLAHGYKVATSGLGLEFNQEPRSKRKSATKSNSINSQSKSTPKTNTTSSSKNTRSKSKNKQGEDNIDRLVTNDCDNSESDNLSGLMYSSSSSESSPKKSTKKIKIQGPDKDKDNLVGQRVVKHFKGHGWFEGSITECWVKRNSVLYKVYYPEDDDEEDLTLIQTKKLLKNADIYSKENIQELQRNRENNESVSENNSKIKAMNKTIGEKRTIESVESSERTKQIDHKKDSNKISKSTTNRESTRKSDESSSESEDDQCLNNNDGNDPCSILEQFKYDDENKQDSYKNSKLNGESRSESDGSSSESEDDRTIEDNDPCAILTNFNDSDDSDDYNDNNKNNTNTYNNSHNNNNNHNNNNDNNCTRNNNNTKNNNNDNKNNSSNNNNNNNNENDNNDNNNDNNRIKSKSSKSYSNSDNNYSNNNNNNNNNNSSSYNHTVNYDYSSYNNNYEQSDYYVNDGDYLCSNNNNNDNDKHIVFNEEREEYLSEASAIPEIFFILKIETNKAFILNMHFDYIRQSISQAKYKFNMVKELSNKQVVEKTLLERFLIDQLSLSIVTNDNMLNFPTSNQAKLYLIIGKLILINGKSSFVACIIPGFKSFEESVIFIKLSQNKYEDKLFYDKVFKLNNKLQINEKEDIKLSEELNLTLFYKLILIKKESDSCTKQVREYNFEREWNSSYNYKSNNDSIIQVGREKKRPLAKPDSVALHSIFLHLFAEEAKNRNNKDNYIHDKRRFAQSGINRNSSKLLDLSNVTVKKPNTGNNCWKHAPNRREEELSKILKCDETLNLSNFIKQWVITKATIRADLSGKESEETIENIIASTACLFSHDPSWFIQEPESEDLKSFKNCEIDIDSAAVTATFDNVKVMSFCEEQFSLTQEEIKLYLKSDYDNNIFINLLLKHWLPKILFVLTNERQQSDCKRKIYDHFITKKISFNKSTIFSKVGNKNIIQKINYKKDNYFFIPTSDDSPFHFSISFPKRDSLPAERIKETIFNVAVIVSKYLNTEDNSWFKSSCAKTEASQCRDTKQLNFTCSGGCLLSILVLIILGAIFSSDEVSMQIHSETYNAKKSGMSNDITKILSSTDINNILSQAEYISENYFQELFSMQPPFIMVRLIGVLKSLLNDENFKFTWGVGSTASGMTQSEQPAMILYKTINLNEHFKTFRNGKMINIFTDQFQTNSNQAIRYNLFLLEKARGSIDFFHPLCGILPMQSLMNVYPKRKNRYSQNTLYTINDRSQLKSEIIKTQQYLVPIRFATGEAYIKDPASKRAFNLPLVSVSRDNKCIINLDTLKIHVDEFFTNFNDTKIRFQNQLESRFEITSVVTIPKKKSILKGLTNLIRDVLFINKNHTKCYNGYEYGELLDFYQYSLRGLTNTSIDSLQSLQTNSQSENKNDISISQRLSEFDKSHIELRSYFSTAWKGTKHYFDSINQCSRLEVSRGRSFFNVFKKFTIKKLLDNQYTNNYYKMLLTLNKINYQKSINNFENLWKIENDIVDPKILAKSLLNNCNSDTTKVCPSCWQMFENDSDVDKNYLAHPCVLSVQYRSQLVESNNREKVISIHDQLFKDYLHEIASNFSKPQNEAAILAIEGTSNIWIYGPAGFGKTFVTDWIIKYLVAKLGFKKVLVCAMTKVSSKMLDGKTVHSLFKLGILTVNIYKYIHHRGKRLKDEVRNFIGYYFDNKEKIIPFLNAEYFVLDEAVQLNLDLHDFLNEVCKQLRNNDDYFGGLRVIFTGDALQKKAGFIDENLIEELRKLGIPKQEDGDKYFFLSHSFLQEGKFKAVLLSDHKNSRYKSKEWFEFCSRCRTGKLTVDDFTYITDRTKIGYKITEDEKYFIRNYALNVNKEILLSDLNQTTKYLNDKMIWRCKNPNLTGVVKKRLDNILSYKDEFKFEEHIQKESLLNETLFIVTENCQVSKYSEFQKRLVDNVKQNNCHDKFYECISKDELYAVKQNTEHIISQPILIESYLNDKRSYYSEIYKKYLDKSNLVHEEGTIIFSIGQVGNITTNSCGRFLAASQRFTIKSIELENSSDEIVKSLLIRPHELDNKLSSDFITLNRISAEYPLSYTDIPYNTRKNYNTTNYNFYVKRSQFPISMTNSKTVQYVMGLTIPDGIICYDNSRGSNYAEGYTCITRSPSPEYFLFVHEIESLEELQLSFRPNPIALKFDEYLVNQCKKLGTCVIDIDFIYNDTKGDFEQSNDRNIKDDNLVDKYLKANFKS